MDVTQVNVQIVLMFMKFLANNRLSVDSIRNYISAVTRYFKSFELQHEIFSHDKMSIMFRADVLINANEMILLVKWSKALQATNQGSKT